MKWVVVWVAVFLGSVVVFVAIPTPALYWVANRNSLDVFGDGSAQPAGDPRSGRLSMRRVAPLCSQPGERTTIGFATKC